MGPPAQSVRSGSGTGVADNIKHRACDECRSRKLACTKEPDGCARCKREGIVCHYSAQKPMGRPRKRATITNPAQVLPEAPVVVHESQHPETTGHGGVGAPAADPLPMELDLDAMMESSLHVDMADTSFLDLLGPDFLSTQPFDATKSLPPVNLLEGDIWKFDINFDPHFPPPSGSTAMPSSQNTPSLSSQGTSPPDITPSEPAAFPSTDAPADAAGGDPALQPVTCSCLANLYLALDSIARLPAEVMPAMRIARGACKAAHDTMQCQVCCPPLHEAMRSPPSTFQNMMILGALLPSIAHAYHRILALVDAETSRAIATHTQIPFSLSAYGGVWGTFGTRSTGHIVNPCAAAAAHMLEDQTLDPAMWRLTVRALLKVDVYGSKCGADRPPQSQSPALSPPGSGSGPGPGSGPSPRRAPSLTFTQMGLRDLVAQMDEKSRTRHAEIDAIIDAGLPAPEGLGGARAKHTQSLADQGREPHCRHTIRMAREAVETLVIP